MPSLTYRGLTPTQAVLLKRFNLELYMNQYLLLNKMISNEPQMKARAKKKVLTS